MVDFKKHLTGKKVEKPSNPVELYDTLDRASDKGPLRPAQIAVLNDWFSKSQQQRDLIVKLHTGQGKTLIGLLMLQSRLNAGNGPVAYLCPNNYLISQTCLQAKQFGIATCLADDEIPDDFINGKKILVTSVQKLFNGLTKFGLHKKSINVDTLLMDDAHACADSIRDACRIRIPSNEPAYSSLRTLFAQDLEQQGMGTFADIENGKKDQFLPVPYWAWGVRESEIAGILSDNASRASIRFAWPLLKDMLNNCQAVISGAAVEIEPYIAPLSAFGTYWKAKHRIFMSATVTDDAFLVKGLQLSPEVIINPLSYEKESWSGEKMLLIPSIIHNDLHRGVVIDSVGPSNKSRKYGRVVLVPSFERAKEWKEVGAIVADTDSVSDLIGKLRNKDFEHTIVLANRYDGIDLPDSTCRILVFDGRPYSENLCDLYEEYCRPHSKATVMRIVRTVEQGMGRSVRGEKDYSVVIAIGPDLVRLLRDRESKEYLSAQMAAQIEIGLDIAEMARQDVEAGQPPEDTFQKLIQQCTGRDDDWKAFYAERMDKVKPKGANKEILSIYASELKSEQAYMNGNYSGAIEELQKLIDGGVVDADDKGWYLQSMARYSYEANRPESKRLQVMAHKKNHLLLRPPSGVTVAKLTVVSQGRVERISQWVGAFENYSDLDVRVSDILDKLVFGTKADKFEQALDELSRALGFAGERPDKEWKEGPDNLWALDATQYIMWECKSEVSILRSEINKSEAEQMNRSSSWFDKHYQGMQVRRIIVHPSNTVQSAAAFTHEVQAMREAELKKLVKAVRSFFKSFELVNFRDLSASQIQKAIDAHGLSVAELLDNYSKKLKNLK